MAVSLAISYLINAKATALTLKALAMVGITGGAATASLIGIAALVTYFFLVKVYMKKEVGQQNPPPTPQLNPFAAPLQIPSTPLGSTVQLPKNLPTAEKQKELISFVQANSDGEDRSYVTQDKSWEQKTLQDFQQLKKLPSDGCCNR